MKRSTRQGGATPTKSCACPSNSAKFPRSSRARSAPRAPTSRFRPPARPRERPFAKPQDAFSQATWSTPSRAAWTSSTPSPTRAFTRSARKATCARSRLLQSARACIWGKGAPSFCSRRNRRWAAFRRCARFRAGAKRATRTTSPRRTPKDGAPAKRWPRPFPVRKKSPRTSTSSSFTVPPRSKTTSPKQRPSQSSLRAWKANPYL